MPRATDPLAGSAWSEPQTVAGFVQSPPNATLMTFAERELRRGGEMHALDVGCGAGRNAIPLAQLGWHVTGIDLSWPMLDAAARRARDGPPGDRLRLVLAPMDVLPLRDRSCDLVIAHGIWNLSGVQPSTAGGARRRSTGDLRGRLPSRASLTCQREWLSLEVL
jgi:SAM-dependent methyltransferase